MSKNILKRILVILTLLASLALLVYIGLEVYKIFQVATDIQLTMTVAQGSRQKLTRLDAPVQRLVYLLAVWIVLQLIFFIGLLVHFFKSTRKQAKATVAAEEDEEDYDSRRRSRESLDDSTEPTPQAEADQEFEFADDFESDPATSSADLDLDEAEEEEEILEVPQPVGRRSRKNRRK